MKGLYQYGKLAVLINLIIPTFLMAQEEGDHVPIGTRKPSVNSSLHQENFPLDQPFEDIPEGKEEARSGFIFDYYPMVYYPASYHSLSGVSVLGDQLDLEDGSVWKINPYDSYKLKSWHFKDILTITQNTRWFSSYNYKIINKNTGTSVETNLFLGPIKNGAYTHYILSIDPYEGTLKLTDNSHWEVSSGDRDVFKDWAIEDTVILGINSGWDSACEAILINVTLNNFIRAKQF